MGERSEDFDRHNIRVVPEKPVNEKPAEVSINSKADNAVVLANRGAKAEAGLPAVAVQNNEIPPQFADQAKALKQQSDFADLMNRNGDVQAVFAPPKRGGTDYFDKVDGKDDPGWIWDGKDGKITKEGMQKYLDENDHPRRTRDPQETKAMAGMHKLLENWDNPDMAKYKTEDGSGMTRDSFKAGMEAQDRQVAEATTKLAADIEKAKAPPAPERQEQKPDVPGKDQPKPNPDGNPDQFPDKRNQIPDNPAAPAALNDGVDKLALVKKGEGPYQVAARILSIDGQKHDHKEVMALTRALQAQYREENQNDASMSGLRVNHALLSAQNADKVLAHISDAKLREKIKKEVLKAS